MRAWTAVRQGLVLHAAVVGSAVGSRDDGELVVVVNSPAVACRAAACRLAASYVAEVDGRAGPPDASAAFDAPWRWALLMFCIVDEAVDRR